MRHRALVIAFALAGVVACKSFGTDPASATPPEEDAGVAREPDAKADPARVEAGAETSTTLGTDRFGPITYDRFDDFDHRADPPAGGAMDWKQDNDQYIDVPDCDEDDTKFCAGSTVRTVGDSVGYGHLETALASKTRIVRIDFSLRLSRTNGGEPKAQAQLVSLALTGSRYLIFEVLDGNLRVADQKDDTRTLTLGPATYNQWARYQLYFDLDQKVIAVAQDGIPFSDVLTIRDEILAPPVELVSARLGLTFMVWDDFQLQFDNVGILELPK